MRGRAQSRGASRTKSLDSSSPSVSNKKTTKLPQIGYFQDDSSSQSAAHSSGLLAAVCTQQGKRPYQEDEYAIRPYINQYCASQERVVETHFFGLFDGHAGGRCSNHVASCLANVLAEDSSFVTNLPQALKRSFHTANEQFLKIAEKMKYHDGSTGIVAIVRDRKVLVANVGDCRALIVSGGRAIQMSIDQKPTNPEEQKRIAALGGTVVYCMGVARVNRVLAVSRAFGNRTLRQVIRPDAEMMQRELTKDDDYLVMASDGLWDVMKNKDVCDYCYSPYTHSNPQIIADELVQAALMRGSMDNVTCVVVKLSDYVQRMLSGGTAASMDNSGAAAPLVSHSEKLADRTSSPSPNKGYRNGNSSNNDDTPPAVGAINRHFSLGSIKSGSGSGATASPSKGFAPPLQKAPSSKSDSFAQSDTKGSQLLPSNLSSASTGGVAQSSPGGLFSLSKSDSDQWSSGNTPPPMLEHMDSIIQDDGDEDEEAVNDFYFSRKSGAAANSNGSSSSQQVGASNSSSGANGGVRNVNNSNSTGGVANSATGMPYASRRPNTVGGQAVGGASRSSFTSGMPHLISMFGSSQQGKGPVQQETDGSAATGRQNLLVPVKGQQQQQQHQQHQSTTISQLFGTGGKSLRNSGKRK